MLPAGGPIHVRKLRPDGTQAFAWEGVVVRCDTTGIVVRACFNVEHVDLGFTTFDRGDEFLEFYYWDSGAGRSTRYYNVFQISSPGGVLKGWYCNVALPAELDAEFQQIAYVDLELDVWVHPDGQSVILDQDDFERLLRDHPELAERAQQGRTALLELVQGGQLPRWSD